MNWLVLAVLSAVLYGGYHLFIKLAVLGGLSIGLAEILAFYVFSRGVPVSLGAPIIVGGTVAVTALYGMLFLRESLVSLQWLGFVLIILGAVLLIAFKRAG